MSEKNKTIVKRLIQEINDRNLDVLTKLCAPNYVYHGTGEMTKSDREGMKKFVSEILSAFPDMQFTIEDIIAEGDKVVYRFLFRGTHKGELFGVAPTGRRVSVRSISINRIVDGKLVEEWENFDELGLMQELGVTTLPLKVAARAA
jgi:steroid delta-isomerase-like uncharacterized protein